jgi:nicotinamidase/pyrazinamidase
MRRKGGEIGLKSAVIVVDLQGDFTTFKRGSLAVKGTGRAYLKRVEEATRLMRTLGLAVYGTQDWHPRDHVSFFTSHEGKRPFEVIEIGGRRQVLWPPHCVKGTENARIVIDNNLFTAIVKKGQDPLFDSYSAFEDEGGQRTELDELLKYEEIGRVIVYGLATDYCVKATAIDGKRYGYEVYVIEDLCKAVDAETERLAKEEMSKAGVKFVRFSQETIRSLLRSPRS